LLPDIGCKKEVLRGESEDQKRHKGLRNRGARRRPGKNTVEALQLDTLWEKKEEKLKCFRFQLFHRRQKWCEKIGGREKSRDRRGRRIRARQNKEN